MVTLLREGKRTSGLLEYVRGWGGDKVTRGEWGEVIRVNGKIAEINNMIDTLKGRMMKEERGDKQ